jgi:hypothetical protein
MVAATTALSRRGLLQPGSVPIHFIGTAPPVLQKKWEHRPDEVHRGATRSWLRRGKRGGHRESPRHQTRSAATRLLRALHRTPPAFDINDKMVVDGGVSVTATNQQVVVGAQEVGSYVYDLRDAIQCQLPVTGLTHNFYRYPARFSPAFARAAILAFTQPGDTVFDPFMGGGTSLVEASVLGRKAVGTDINPIATFVTKVKTTPLSEAELTEIGQWGGNLIPALNLHCPTPRADSKAASGYQQNINGRTTWPIRKALDLALKHVGELHTPRQRRFAQCALLRTGQWALDCRTTIPSAEEFRQQFLSYLSGMIDGASRYAQALTQASGQLLPQAVAGPLCLTRSAIGVESDPALVGAFPPKLILTSPPYPGVHVLYHRWQVQGRKETPAPFWIVGCADGNGASHYTFGDRKRPGLTPYYENLSRAYSSLARVADEHTTLVQMVAFSDPSWQLPNYLAVLDGAGFNEIKFWSIANSKDGRVWRSVPHRKWYADRRGRTTSSNEVVLFHRFA